MFYKHDGSPQVGVQSRGKENADNTIIRRGETARRNDDDDGTKNASQGRRATSVLIARTCVIRSIALLCSFADERGKN